MKNSTRTGKNRSYSNKYHSLRLSAISISLFIFVLLAIYTMFLIQKAREEHEKVPHIFAKYVAYTDAYLRRAEQYSQLITEISSKYLQFTTKRDFQQQLWDYIAFDFMQQNPISIIISDANRTPVLWKNVSVSSDSLFEDLSPYSKESLIKAMDDMLSIPLIENEMVNGYAFYAKPISLEEFIRGIDYSIIVTDQNREPLFWRNVGIEEELNFFQLSIQDQFSLLAKQGSMTEIPLLGNGEITGYIYFSGPQSLSYIRFIILLEVFLALMVVFFGGYSLFLTRRSEKESLWVSLAKETAHQFGTPITSLMGWIDYLAEPATESSKPRDMKQITDYMRTDLNHLHNIASRFGKVGSEVKLEPIELNPILLDMVDYYRDRMPHLSSKVEIHLISKIEGVKVMLVPELIKWSLENLIKNCLDAMTGKGGDIIITATHKESHVYLHIRDEGKGIPHNQWRNIFNPGVTTKDRGWGLGLSLAKRIINEYHQGYIRVIQSTLNEGTTFEIRLNTIGHKKRRK